MSAHTSVRKGTHVVVHLKSGIILDDQFVERKSTYVLLKRAGRLKKADIRALSIKRL